MKKKHSGLLRLTALFLALIMLLGQPVSAAAEEFGAEAAEGTEATAESTETPAEGTDNPAESSETLAETSESLTKDIDRTEEETPEITGEETPEETPEVTVEELPVVTPEVTGEESPDETLETAGEDVPEETDHNTPEAEAETSPDEGVSEEAAEEPAEEPAEEDPSDPSEGFEYSEADLQTPFDVSLAVGYGTVKSYAYSGRKYLFVPNGFPLSSLTVSFAGAVTSVSRGTLDPASHTVSGAFTHGEAVAFTMADGSTVSVIFLQSSLPSISVWLDGYTLSDIHADKELKAAGTSIVLADPANAANNIEAAGAEFKGRGNSSWRLYEKKGYQIKFSQKTSLFGLGAAKKWILLPNAGDGSMMKNRIAFELASGAGMAFAPTGHYADLWINGEYRGLYLVTDKVEIGKTRLNLKDAKGVLAELDNEFYAEESAWFRSSVTGFYYTLKESVDESSDAGFTSFRSALENLEWLLHNGGSWSDLTAAADMDSFVDVYLVNEVLLNKEVLGTSCFFYKDGDADKIHMGPVWDFDTCMNSRENDPSICFVISHGKVYSVQADFFLRLSEYQEFVDLINRRYESYYKPKLAQILGMAETWYSSIAASADMNYLRWPVLGTTSAKNEYYYPTYRQNVDALLNWLSARLQSLALVKTAGTASGMSDGVIRTYVSITDESQLSYYSPVFDAQYYYDNYADLRAAIGMNKTALLNHFLNYGIYENRQACVNFNITYYIVSNPDLREVYGGEYLRYVRHYIKTGQAEGRFGSYEAASAAGHGGTDQPQEPEDPAEPEDPGNGGVTAPASLVWNGRDYSPVFDASYYLDRYADLRAAFGTDGEKAFRHFLSNGMTEGRRASAAFSVKYYRDRYPDLQRAFGNSYVSYFHHYLDNGIREGRKGADPADSVSPGGNSGPDGSGTDDGSGGDDSGSGTDDGSGGEDAGPDEEETLDYGAYAAVFDADYYLAKYADLRAAFGTDRAAAYRHFLSNGMREGRQGIASFNVQHYQARYADLRAAFGNNLPAYYEHYIRCGRLEGRNGY